MVLITITLPIFSFDLTWLFQHSRTDAKSADKKSDAASEEGVPHYTAEKGLNPGA
jgi:hypothetical protein